MTLILAITGPESIWLLADRRLSSPGYFPKDDGRKVMFLETTDGTAILGYAGLGATARGTEPADWMSAVLRGRKLSLEQSLSVLAKAMQSQFPQHMIRMPVAGGPVHNVIVPAFLGAAQRLYSIDLVFAPDQKSCELRCTRQVAAASPSDAPRTPRLAVAGSGALYLKRDNEWMRSLLRLVRRVDRGSLRPLVVADHLAKLNNEVHLATANKSVGPRCVVAWRFRKGGLRKGGGASQCYTGLKRDHCAARFPIIGNGLDVSAIAYTVKPFMESLLNSKRPGEPAQEFDSDGMKTALARLPLVPDEDLR